MKTKLQTSVQTLCKSLSEDKDLYYSYQANIAVQFQDVYHKELRKKNYKYMNSDDIHKISNDAAKLFLDLLIRR